MKATKAESKRSQPTEVVTAPPVEQAFAEVVEMIRDARGRALLTVNTVVIDLYWQVGEYISRRIDTEGWGKGTVAALSAYIQKRNPGVRGFSPQNLWRMRQFFETYREQPILSTLLRELQWSSRPEEREFYLRLATQQRWSVREVARQIDSALFERAVLNPPKISAALRESRPSAETTFRDAYVVEFLELPDGHREVGCFAPARTAKWSSTP